MYRAVLDTVTLVPGLQRDFLLQLAAEGAYAPFWGTGILFELDYVLERLAAKKGRADSQAQREHLFAQMHKAFPGATIDAPKDRKYAYDLADPDDGHVAHAAIIGKADAIVTGDKRTGMETSQVLLQASVQILRPAQFAANTVAAHPIAGIRALEQMARRMKKPPRTPSEVLADLVEVHGMTEVASLLGPLLQHRAADEESAV